MSKLSSIKVGIKLPFLAKIEGVWEPDEDEQKAAWEMYVELVTRISVVELKSDEGLLREALSSLYTLFATTRQILREYGPKVAQPKGKGELSFGKIAITILNEGLRPVLAKWHPLLLDHESKRTKSSSLLEHERTWEKADELRTVLNSVRESMLAYSNLLAQVADISPISPSVKDT